MSESPAQNLARRNLRFGFVLGAVALALMVGFMIHFTKHGLPKDGDVHRVLHREGRVGHPLGDAPESSTLAPVPPAAVPQKETP